MRTIVVAIYAFAALCFSAPAHAQIVMGDYYIDAAGSQCPMDSRTCNFEFLNFPDDAFTRLTLISCRVLVSVAANRLEILPTSYEKTMAPIALPLPTEFHVVNQNSMDQRLYVFTTPIDLKLAKSDSLKVWVGFAANVPNQQAEVRCTASGYISPN